MEILKFGTAAHTRSPGVAFRLLLAVCQLHSQTKVRDTHVTFEQTSAQQQTSVNWHQSFVLHVTDTFNRHQFLIAVVLWGKEKTAPFTFIV